MRKKPKQVDPALQALQEQGLSQRGPHAWKDPEQHHQAGELNADQPPWAVEQKVRSGQASFHPMPGLRADLPQSGLTGLVLGHPQPAGNQIPTVLAALGTAASSGAPQKANGGGTSSEALLDSRHWASRAERGRTRNSWRAQGRRGPWPRDTWVPDLDHPSLHLQVLPLQRPSLSPH